MKRHGRDFNFFLYEDKYEMYRLSILVIAGIIAVTPMFIFGCLVLGIIAGL